MSKNYNKYFPYLNNNDEIYFDNAATSLKLRDVIEAEKQYNESINANPHTRDFQNAFKATQQIEDCRKKVAKFIGADSLEEVIFTSGTTHSLNQVAFGIENLLINNKNVVITQLEHSSNILPWFSIREKNGIEVRYAPLKEDGLIDIENLDSVIDENTLVLSFASVSNTIGAINDVAKIAKIARKINNNIMICVDAAQSVGHIKTDVKSWDIDFLAFSAHKMFGPFGLGVLWGKKKSLQKLKPIFYGGGNNDSISKDGYVLSDLPKSFEAGTPNIAAIYAFGKVFDFYENVIGINEIHKIEKELKEYAIQKFKNLKDKRVVFYNLENTSPILLFNVEGIPSQDLGTYLSSEYKISVRTGSHCAKLTSYINEIKTTVRASFMFINTKEEIDKLSDALEKASDNWLNSII